MQTSICFYCRLATRFRLKNRLVELENVRRRLSSTSQSELAGSWYWDTTAPTKENLAAAAHFFRNHKPSRLWTGDLWKTSEVWRRSKKASNQQILVPEVVFLGRSNVGKSTLINALTSADLNRVSTTPGMTEVMAAWGLAAKEQHGGAMTGWDGDMTPKVTLVDMPGYGFGSRSEWGNHIVSYMNKRRNLRRAFLLVDSAHGIMAADRHMLEIFRKLGIPFQLIATKCDRLRTNASESDIREALEKIKAQANTDNSALMLGEIIAVGSLQDASGAEALREAGFGIKNLQWAILKAANLEWFAMDKAALHKVIDKSATQRPQGKIDAEISKLIHKKDNATDPSKSTDTTTSSSQSLPNLSLQEFMREILGTGSSEKDSSTTQPGRHQPRVFDPVKSKPTDWKPTKDLLDKQFDSAFKELQTHIKPESMSRQPAPGSVSSSMTNRTPLSTRPTQSSGASTTVAEGVDAFEAMFAGPTRPPPVQAARHPLSKRAAPATSGSQPSQQPQMPPPSGKGVSRGIDAFEAMFAEPRNQQARGKQAQSFSGRRGRGAKASPSSAQIPQPENKPAIVGKGVSQGFHAFESMFAEATPKRSRKAWRKG